MPESEGPQSRRTKAKHPKGSDHVSSREPQGVEPTPGLEELRLLGLGGDFSQSTFERHAALLGDSRMSQPIYAGQRAMIAQQLQRDYGNRYVQRLVDHITAPRDGSLNAASEIGSSGTGATAGHRQDTKDERLAQVEAVTFMQRAIEIQRAIEASPGGPAGQRELYHPWEALLPPGLIRARAPEPITRTNHTKVQPKLMVGPAGDRYEQEADHVAKQVMDMLSSPSQGLVQRQNLKEEQLQRKPLVQRQVSAAGGDVEAGVEQSIQKARGQGQALAESVRAPMENALGADFSGVRVHTGPEADALNDSMSARAFTTGQDVFIRREDYSPDSTAGQELIAHELTHVVQQSGPAVQRKPEANAPANESEQPAEHPQVGETRKSYSSVALQIRRQLRDSRLTPDLIQRAVNTWGGEYDTDKYEAVTLEDVYIADGVATAGKDRAELEKKVGLKMELKFKPGEKANAELIGMVQSVVSQDKGAILALSPTVGARSIPAGAGAGVHIDQLAKFRNPLYATGAGTDEQMKKLATTPTHAQWGQHGYRYEDPPNPEQVKDAVLKDKPQLPGRGKNASQTFESTAVAVKGAQTGTYYGTVQWGWKSDNAGKFTQLPLSRVSKDVPSDVFAKAAKLWAKKPTSTDEKTLPLPVVEGKNTKRRGVRVVRDPANPVDTTEARLYENTRVEVTERRLTRFFGWTQTGSHHEWSKVTVVSGSRTGMVGWVRSDELQ